MTEFDLAIIGGGINGTAIARDAAGRGIRVLLVEQNDLAAGTSSASTKLIHGGLRYPLGARRVARARAVIAHGAAPDLAGAFRAPASRGTAAGLAAQARPLPL
jgi:glycine/D-amino acid oxidase-like deaminating enzyme